jgi:hypothetical protein
MTVRPRAAAGVSLAVLAVLAGACTKKPQTTTGIPPTPMGVSKATSGTPIITSSAAPSESSLPTPSAPTGAVIFTRGSAHVSTTGDLELKFDADLAPGSALTQSAASLIWGVSGSEGRLQISGPISAGSTPFLGLTLPTSAAPVSLFARPGQCDVEFTRAGLDGVSGTFDCKGLHALVSSEVVDARGSFEASP